MALMVAVAFAGMAFAVGHVGHVDENNVVDYTPVSIDQIDVNEGDFSITPITPDEVKNNIGNVAFVGLPEDASYTLTVHNATFIEFSEFASPLVFSFSNVPGDWTGIMIEKKNEEDVFQYFPKEPDGSVIIDNPEDFFTKVILNQAIEEEGSAILFVELKEESEPVSGGGGGGGCSLGMLSPFALLLAVPLVLLRK